MADAVLGAIVTKAADIAVSRIVKETSRLSRVREDLAWIEVEMRRIRSYLKDAETKKSRTEGVSNFIRDISDLAYDVEDIIDMYFPKMRLNRSRWKRLLDFSNMKIARGFVKEVEGIRRRVEDIKSARQTFGIDESSQSHEDDTWHQRISFPHLDEPNVVGFDNLIGTLVHKVLDKYLHHRVVSIIGFAGLGKTTLARKVYKIARQSLRQRFDCAAWICVSQSPNVKALMRDIAGQVGLEKEKIEQNVETYLYEFLGTKRYVVVIDDIWNNNAWDALKIGLPTNSENGSCIILTSRNRYVGVHVGGLDSVLELEPLDQETSRRLFYKIVVDDQKNIPKTLDPQLENVGEQILKRCGGVPLAIVLAAGLLKVRERSETVWKGALENMGQENDQCAEIFALSYKDLPLNLKPCFLYFGIFSDDLEVGAFDLINLWAAEGFIRGSRVREVEDVGDDYLNHLVARNLIQVVDRRFNGRVRSVRIHDILHTLCIRVANEINFFNIHGDEIDCNTTLKVRRFVLHESHYPALYPKTSSLRAAFSFGPQEPWDSKVGKNLLRDSKFLRVLSVNMSGSDISTRSILIEICNLRQLTYLKFAMWSTIEIPYAIRNLNSLLTLDLGECEVVGLPNVIWSMKQLRNIILPEWCETPSFWGENLDVFHPVEISLPNLQTLQCSLLGDFFKADYLHKLNSLRTLRVYNVNEDIFRVLSNAAPVPHKLEELSLSTYAWHGKEPISLNFSRFDNLSTLFISGVTLNELSHDILPPNLVELRLKNTHLRTDPMEALKKLQKLEILYLDKHAYFGKKLVCSGEAGNFPQLQVLEIRKLTNLEMVVVEEGALPRLMDFKIVRCNIAEIRVPDRIRNVMKVEFIYGYWNLRAPGSYVKTDYL